jgi:hypothetical protein
LCRIARRVFLDPLFCLKVPVTIFSHNYDGKSLKYLSFRTFTLCIYICTSLCTRLSFHTRQIGSTKMLKCGTSCSGARNNPIIRRMHDTVRLYNTKIVKNSQIRQRSNGLRGDRTRNTYRRFDWGNVLRQQFSKSQALVRPHLRGTFTAVFEP